ncbi:MAG TPA: hypothetical protein P5081_02415 [Phycisphaerae bacterium]|nr:hypothetical protein [Phycisphaerae bacterium]HRW51711.1 hypothetical protein [Phycisphaerae bacterium]
MNDIEEKTGGAQAVRRSRLPWIAIALAIILGGWMTFDGLHALVTGDFVTASSGEYAGQLGPWSKLVEAVGIPPRSLGMKVVHVALGFAWLVAVGLFAARRRLGRVALGMCAIAGLWYLPFGTIIGVIVLGLLRTRALRSDSR